MPNMISLRSFRLATTKGYIYQFIANEPLFVHPECVTDAMAQGCVPADAEDAPFIEDMGRATVDFAGDVRQSLIFMAISAIVDANNVAEFTAAGYPKPTAVSDRLGIVTNEAEVSNLYRLYTTAKSEGRELDLHPKAHMALRVIEATNRRDLDMLASELEVTAKQAKGLDGRALRKLLLTKLSGVAAE